MQPEQYFRDRVRVDANGCWIWTLRCTKQGYGRMKDGPRNGALAHRCSYETFVGPITDGMTVDHLCFEPSCVNPQHLRLLTHEANSANNRNALKTHCVNGHEFTPENTYARPGSGNGLRQCRACQRAAVARYKQRKSA